VVTASTDEGKIDIRQLDGGAALCTWFGRTPSFHDAKLSRLELRQGSDSFLTAHIFEAGPEVDSDGYYVQTKHAAVTFTLGELIAVELYDFMEAGIMFGLDIEADAEGVTLRFDASYGVNGQTKAKRASVSFAPEDAAAS
jgi:hypothetical protein